MNDLMTQFRSNELTPFLTESDIKRQCPVAFLTEPTNDRLTDKYQIATTIDVVRDLERLNWHCVSAAQKRQTAKSGRYSFHALYFQNPDVFSEDGYPRILLTNSHDGTSSFHFGCAFYRLVCSNGLIIADNNMADLKIRHIYYTFESIQKMVVDITQMLPQKLHTIEQMKQTVLGDNDRYEFVNKAFRLRVPTYPQEESISDEIVEQWLNPLRTAESEPTLWNTYNTVQERVMKGIGQIIVHNKVRKMRTIRSPKTNIDFNTGLWKIAQEFLL